MASSEVLFIQKDQTDDGETWGNARWPGRQDSGVSAKQEREPELWPKWEGQAGTARGS